MLWFAPRTDPEPHPHTFIRDHEHVLEGLLWREGWGQSSQKKCAEKKKIFLIKKSLFRTKNQYFSS